LGGSIPLYRANYQTEDILNWYANNTEKLKKLFGADYTMVAGLIAATSPRRDLKRNLRTAINIYRAIKKDPTLIHYSPRKFQAKFQIMGAHYKNVLRAINGSKLSGLKVEAFRQNLSGNLQPVTIDVWMMRYFNYTGNLTPKIYKQFSEQITELAAAEGLAPAQMQSILWNRTRRKAGFKAVNFDFSHLEQFSLWM
jgi:L-asparaginase/Glu-tRNA(Gln) amidotransferase subunit D